MKLRTILIALLFFIIPLVKAVDEPTINIQVVKDDIFLMVMSKVQFTIWNTTNLKGGLWWRQYTSPKPAFDGQILIWFGYGSKSELFPNYSFYKVTAITPSPLK